MGSLSAALRGIAPTIEHETSRSLRGPWGILLRSYLPQVWVFASEKEEASLIVDRHGSVTVSPRAVTPTDVTVRARHATLLQVLTRGRGRGFRTKDFEVTVHTRPGRVAFDFLRRRLGF